jgi:AraC family transcriptional activator of tynA and feaB
MRLQELETRFSFRACDFRLATTVGEWSDRLHSVCGGFKPYARHGVDRVVGGIVATRAAGLIVHQVATDVDFVHRDSDNIRLDFSDHLLLLLQFEGACGVEQLGRQSRISPGDCILIDSAHPVKLFFQGQYSNHIAVHLPRRALLGDPAQPLRIAEPLGAEDPMATMLSALVAKIVRGPSHSCRGPQLRELLQHAIKEAFVAEAGSELAAPKDRVSGRLELARLLIDRHLTEERLTPHWLSQRLGISLRTLQEDFSTLGLTVTSFIRDRRLRLAREKLIEGRREGERGGIAGIALASGFNDISYFNRSFKKTFGCSPKEVDA